MEKVTDIISFLLIGDWGKGTSQTAARRQLSGDAKSQEFYLQHSETSNQNAIASAMAEYVSSARHSPSFILTLGDNFYTRGVASSSDSLWESLWKDVYLQYDSLKIPWYGILGNHDYGSGLSGVQGQLSRAREHIDDDLWEMPSTNYSLFTLVGEVSVFIAAIDTVTLAPSENSCCNTKGGVTEAEQLARIQNQLGHIDKMLNYAVSLRPTWLLLAGHYPVFSCGDHGDIDELQKYLMPYLEKYNVHAYLSGHDHISEHLSYKNIHYFVVGAGSMIDQLKHTSQAELLWSGAGYSAFGVMTASVESLRISFVDSTGTETYAYAISSVRSREASGPRGSSGGGTFAYPRSFLASVFPSTSGSGGVVWLLIVLGLAILFVRRRRRRSQQKQREDASARARASSADDAEAALSRAEELGDTEAQSRSDGLYHRTHEADGILTEDSDDQCGLMSSFRCSRDDDDDAAGQHISIGDSVEDICSTTAAQSHRHRQRQRYSVHTSDPFDALAAGGGISMLPVLQQ